MLDEALACNQKAISIKPDSFEAYNNMGGIFTDRGRMSEALSCYQKAIALKADLTIAHSNLLLTLQYSSTLTPADKYAEHLLFAQQFEAPLKPHWPHHANTTAPHKRLKIGYVSADFTNFK